MKAELRHERIGAALVAGRRSMSFNASALRSRNFRQSRIGASLLLLVIMVAGLSIKNAVALAPSNLGSLLLTVIPLILAAMAQQFVILAEGFDIGLGFAIGLTNVLCATILVNSLGIGMLTLLAVVAAYGVMGILVELTGVPGIVVTLGASFVWLGVGLILQPAPGGSVPNWLATGLDASLPGLSEPVYLVLILGVTSWLILRRSRWGGSLRAFAGNATAYRHAGRSSLRARVALYSLAGLCVVLAGMMTTVVFSGSDINASQTLTLASVVAVIIGGGQFLGGVVEPVGTVVAAVALGLIPPVLGGFNINTNYEPAVEGGILILVMALRWLAQRSRRAEQ